ncbi:MAG: hypothetical protein BGN86_01170 [Caulobacterales bacterium 68-7]|nr:MAG: hypothetical protein BGN86_01170 [Caulobacterales bacterium 68-7]
MMFEVLRFLVVLGAALLASGGATAALVGLGGGFSDKLDIANQFAPLWLATSVLALALGLPFASGGWRVVTVAAAIVAILIGGFRVAPEVVARFEPKPLPSASERLKVVHFNVYMLNSEPRQAIAWLLAQDADVVVLVEAEGFYRGFAKDLLSRYPYCNGCVERGNWSNLILSKRPPVDHGRFERPDPDTEFPLLGGWSRFAGPGGDFTVVGAHLTWPWRRFGPPQREALAEFVREGQTDRMVLTGDFNMTPWSTALRRFDRSVGALTRRTHGQASWPANRYYRLPGLPLRFFPLLAIDQVYAGPGWRTVSVKRGPRLGSDHYPIVVELAATPKRP